MWKVRIESNGSEMTELTGGSGRMEEEDVVIMLEEIEKDYLGGK